LKINDDPNPKGSIDFQQFTPFRAGVNKLLKIIGVHYGQTLNSKK